MLRALGAQLPLPHSMLQNTEHLKELEYERKETYVDHIRGSV